MQKTEPFQYSDEFEYSCRFGELDQVQEILEVSSDPYQTIKGPEADFKGLFYACANGHLAILQELLNFITKDDLEYPNKEGNRVLHWAALNNQLEICRELIKQNVNLLLRNAMGKSAATLAEERGFDELVVLILNSYDPDEAEDGQEGEADELVEEKDEDGPSLPDDANEE